MATDERASGTNAYRQVQFALDDELVNVGQAPRAEAVRTADVRAPSDITVELAAAIEDAKAGAPFRFATATDQEVTAPDLGGAVTLLIDRARIAAAAAGSTRREAPEPPTEVLTDRVGVVFVHGVGSQAQSETVREFGQPLIEWLEQWHHSRDLSDFNVLWSRLSYGDTHDGPAAYAVRIPAYEHHEARTWFLAEAWWASRLSAPSAGTVLGWALGSLPSYIWALWRQAVRVLRGQRYPGGRRMTEFGQAIALLNTVLVLAGYAIAFIPAQLLVLVLSAAALIPLPGLQQFVLLRILQPLLVNNLGDFVVYMHDDVQAVHIRQSVYDAVSWLVRKKGCARVVVVAHSQGTVVAFDALSAANPGGSQPDGPSLESDLGRVTKVVTFGAALNRMWEERDRAEKAGRLLRPFADDLTRGEIWTNLYSEFDWAPGGPLTNGRSARNEPVTNNLSAISDHGEYFNNHEQFTSLLAQEIDSPRDREDSRFWPRDKKIKGGEVATGADRVDENRLNRVRRVTTWALWRSVAWAAVFVAFVLRYGQAGRDIPADADALLRFVTDLPLVGAIPGFLTTLGEALTGLAEQAPALDGIADWIRLGLVPVLLAGLVVCAIVVLSYTILVWALFTRWHRQASLSTAHQDPRGWSWWQASWRTATYILVMSAVSFWVAMIAPPLQEVGNLLTAVTR